VLAVRFAHPRSALPGSYELIKFVLVSSHRFPLLPRRTHAMADSDDIKKANEDLSRILRASIFPGAISSFPKRSVTQEMLAQAEPDNPEYKCDAPPRPARARHATRAPTPCAGARVRAGADARGPAGSSRGAPRAPALRSRAAARRHHLAHTAALDAAAAGRVDKTHFSVKYDIKAFMEAEFARRNLFKQIAKEGGK